MDPCNDRQLSLSLVRLFCAIALLSLLPRRPHIDRQAILAGVVPRCNDELGSICQPDILCIAFELRARRTEVGSIDCAVLFDLWD